MMWSAYGTGILLVLLTLAGIAVSILRIAAGPGTQRTRGCIALVMIGGMLLVVIGVYVAYFRVIQATTAPLPPGVLPPTTAPINAPAFGTPDSGVEIP